MTKFANGDRIVVVDTNHSEYEDAYLGATGKIVYVDPEYMYPYTIVFDNDYLNRLGETLWSDDEMELLVRDTKVVMDSMKDSIKSGIEELLKQDYRKANIEIDLLHFIKGCLKEEEDYD